MSSSEVLNYRPSWQVLRVSTLKENNPYGGMATPTGAQDAIDRLTNYITDADPSQQLPSASYVAEEITRMGNTLEEEYAVRIFRVYKFLVATTNGIISDPTKTHVRMIRQAADDLSLRLNLRLVDQAASKWNWDVVRYELETLWRRERSWFMAIDADMKERVVEKDKSASNMMTFIALMREVNRLGQP